MSNTFIHPSVEVASGAVVGDGCRIWQQCILGEGSILGRECKLGHNVFVEAGVCLGDQVTVKDNVALYSGVFIEDKVFIGPNAVFTNVLNPRSTISRKDEFRETRIQNGATIGANATIVCGNKIGRYAMIGAGTVVTRDVPDHAVIIGNPGRLAGWVSAAGHKLDADLTCPETGVRHETCADGIRPVA